MLSPLPWRSDRAYCFAHFTQPCQPSLIWQSGRPAHCPFRGLLGVHSRYGLHTRAVTVFRDTLSEGFSHFVTSIAAPVASGWSGCRVGLAPTGKRRLFTAHAKRRHYCAALPNKPMLLIGTASLALHYARWRAMRGIGKAPSGKGRSRRPQDSIAGHRAQVRSRRRAARPRQRRCSARRRGGNPKPRATSRRRRKSKAAAGRTVAARNPATVIALSWLTEFPPDSGHAGRRPTPVFGPVRDFSPV